MKVGTDSTLLGAWAKITQASRILDIGAGSGVISLMLAQRNLSAAIEGVEIEEQAFLQASDNIAKSPWAGRIQLHHCPIQHFNPLACFDAIVSNPPFYDAVAFLKSDDEPRRLARSTQELPYADLVAAVSRLLCPNSGVFSLILPIEIESQFTVLAQKYQLYPTARCLVIPKEGKSANRVLMGFSKHKMGYSESSITLRKRSNASNNYTEEFCALLKDFLIIF